MLARSLVVASMFVLLSAPAVLQRWLGGDTQPYIVTTIALTLAAIALGLSRPTTQRDAAADQASAATSGRYAPTMVVGTLAVILVVFAARSWLQEILTIPVDPFRGDMLVLVREGLRRMLDGLNPYVVYHLPWAMPLTYGPLLWGPYALPMLMRVDLRFLTVVGELFVPAACGLGAIASAARGRLTAAAAALVMLGAIAMNGELARFTSIGHTPAYWPLIALFAWLAARERWTAAAIALGLLVVARTTMIAVVPVLLIAVWMRDRRRLAVTMALVALATVVPFLPFAVWDPRALVYALYGSYQTIIKTVVWPDATVPHTIGVTGVLLSYHLHRFVEAVQIVTMAIVYVGCWGLMRRGRAPVVLMGLALLAFSMTTLWPVTYIYFDVFLLLASGVLAEMPWLSSRRSTSSLVRAWIATAAVAIAFVAGLGTAMLRLRPDGGHVVTWREPSQLASVLVLRRTISPAMVEIQLGAGETGRRQMDVTLNGTPLGAIDVSPGKDRVMLAVPGSSWQLGANRLELSPASPATVRGVTVRPTRSSNLVQP